ncbi:uncharacterized protein JCM6883_005343 [Sporobolomyces salmoneus]|uniref:uncharacterized protein n=1 Tax=Sporobolomyces salmoneus TaxID=183962 RepID=UPI00316EC3C3
MPDTSSSSPTSLSASDRISTLLLRAQQLQRTLSSDPIHETWSSLCEIIDSCRLGELTRHPALEKVYAEEFNPLIRSEFGSVEKYLKSRLNFSPTTSKTTGNEWWTCPLRASDEKAREGRENGEEMGGDGSQARVRVNDWGYSIPSDIQHFVVWVNRPLFHPALCEPAPPDDEDNDGNDGSYERTKRRKERRKMTWEFVQENGLSGLTGIEPSRTRSRPRSDEANGASTLSPDEEEKVNNTQTLRGPGREIEKFVRNRWRVEEGFQTAWFANPPRLQSVPGLAHFHVLVRTRPDSNVYARGEGKEGMQQSENLETETEV